MKVIRTGMHVFFSLLIGLLLISQSLLQSGEESNSFWYHFALEITEDADQPIEEGQENSQDHETEEENTEIEDIKLIHHADILASLASNSNKIQWTSYFLKINGVDMKIKTPPPQA